MTTSGSSFCFDNDDLVHYILQYLDLLEFLPIERLNHRFQHLIEYHYQQYSQNPLYQHYWYKDHLKYMKKKLYMCHILHNQQQYRQGFLLYGGNFGSIRNATCWIHDNPYEFTGYLLPKIPNRGILGSIAMCVDHSQQSLHIIGGWREYYGETSTTSKIYHLENYECIASLELDQPRCFASATSTISGQVVVTGGGDSPYRGATVSNTCLIKPNNENVWLTDIIAPLLGPRCGHGSLTYLNNQLYIIGGYSGGIDYLETVECYDWERNQWQAIPPMRYKRSGPISALGPYGSIYVCGGSKDGTFGNKALERYDPREGVWHELASMTRARGYSSGAVGATGLLYVCGGLDQDPATQVGYFQGGMECYDFKMNRWFGLSGSNPTLTGAGIANYSKLPEKEVSWTNQYYPRKVDYTIHADVLAHQLLRASHQMLYIS